MDDTGLRVVFSCGLTVWPRTRWKPVPHRSPRIDTGPGQEHGAGLLEKQANEGTEALGHWIGELGPVLVKEPLLAADEGADPAIVLPFQAEAPLGAVVPSEEEAEDEPGMCKEREHGDPHEHHGGIPLIDEDYCNPDGEVEEEGQRLVDQVGKDYGHGNLLYPPRLPQPERVCVP